MESRGSKYSIGKLRMNAKFKPHFYSISILLIFTTKQSIRNKFDRRVAYEWDFHPDTLCPRHSNRIKV